MSERGENANSLSGSFNARPSLPLLLDRSYPDWRKSRQARPGSKSLTFRPSCEKGPTKSGEIGDEVCSTLELITFENSTQ